MSMVFIRTILACCALLSADGSLQDFGRGAFAAATASPTVAPTVAPTTAPTTAPTAFNDSSSPTLSPTQGNETNITDIPTTSPTLFPTIANDTNTTAPTTLAPSAPNSSTAPTDEAPTFSPSTRTPSAAPSQKPSKKHHISLITIIGKTIGWLILIVLSVLLFGAIMSNRYRLYYALRGTWFTLFQMDCTRWILAKLNLRGGPTTQASLNEIIFDQNDLAEGLLMGEAD